MRQILLLLFWAMLLLPSNSAAVETPEELQHILNLRGGSESVLDEESPLSRMTHVGKEAYRLGLQTAVKWRNEKFKKILNSKRQTLDSIYAFRLLLIDGQIMPPVIVKSTESYQVEQKSAVRTGTSYKIVSDAHFTSTAPSWRDYLIKDYQVVPVASVLYPRSSEEIYQWQREIMRGWQKGLEHALIEFNTNFRRLDRDILGIMNFITLAKQGVVSLPRIAENRFALRVGNKTLDMDQRTFVIVEDSKFQKGDQWKPFRMSP